MDDEDHQRKIENMHAANFFNSMAASTAPTTAPHISFSQPMHSALPPPLPSGALLPTRLSSETRPSASNRARSHFERASQVLPPLFPLQGPGQFHHSNTPPISPLSLFSPRTGFPGPLPPSFREAHNEASKDRHPPPLTPLSPMIFTPGLSSPMELLPSPMYHVGESSQQTGDCIPKGLTPHISPMDPLVPRSAYDNRNLNDLNSIGFSRHRGLPSTPSLRDPYTASSLNCSSRQDAVSQDPVNTSQEMMGSNTQPHFLPENYLTAQAHLHPNQANLSPIDFPESPMFRSLDHIPLNLPGQPHNPQEIACSSGHQPASSAFRDMSQTPASPMSVSEKSTPTLHVAGGNHHGIYCNPSHLSRHASSALPSSEHNRSIKTSEQTTQLNRMDVVENIQQPVTPHGSGHSRLRVLPQIIIDRPLVRAAEVLQQKVVRSPNFANLVQRLKESHRLSGEDACGGTVRRRSDLIKLVEKIEDYGYPSSDREDIHQCLDTTPGLSRENVEYLKTIVLSQLETVKRGAREALYQFSVILVDQLRYRVMRKEDILALQCSVVDRFVVARNCILEKYIQYVRSRRWIENMSTNQRRGCLTHQQNNILRMWLYRNFTNPYPDDDAKEMMMQETNLCMEQVNNWLINARSRFWKPCMDYFDRSSLERKIGMMIRQRMIMTAEEKIKAASSKSALPESRGRNRRPSERKPMNRSSA